jgi:hypothetical protein
MPAPWGWQEEHAMIARALILSILTALLSFGQATPRQSVPENGKKTTPGGSADTWERSKECAAQAEKVIIDRKQYVRAAGVEPANWDWGNHYSPKYKQCFIRLHSLSTNLPKGAPMSYTMLINAFERNDIATFGEIAAPMKIACQDEADPKLCEEIAKTLWKTACRIEDQPTDCAEANAFISEHMKN